MVITKLSMMTHKEAYMYYTPYDVRDRGMLDDDAQISTEAAQSATVACATAGVGAVNTPVSSLATSTLVRRRFSHKRPTDTEDTTVCSANGLVDR